MLWQPMTSLFLPSLTVRVLVLCIEGVLNGNQIKRPFVLDASEEEMCKQSYSKKMLVLIEALLFIAKQHLL